MSDGGGARIYRLPGSEPERGERTASGFRPFYASQMQGKLVKQREFIVDGVLMRGSVMLFAGAPKIGKGILLQQMLTAVGLGEPWLDRDTIQSRAFGIFTEDSQSELERRQVDINALYERQPADLEMEFAWQSLEGEEAKLVNFKPYDSRPMTTPLWDQLWNYVADEGIKIVGLDNARVMFGGKEIDPLQVEAFVRLLVRKAIEINGAIVLLVHPNKADPTGFAGTGAWLASVRAGMSLRRPRDWDEERDTLRDSRRTLHGLGMNYGAGIGAEQLEIKNGVFMISEHGERVRKRRGPLSETEMTDLRYRLLMGLKRILQNGGRVPADVEDKNSMPHRARRNGTDDVNRVAMNDLMRAQELMIEAEQVVRVQVNGRCLIRPFDGPYIPGEIPWLPSIPPKGVGELRNAAD